MRQRNRAAAGFASVAGIALAVAACTSSPVGPVPEPSSSASASPAVLPSGSPAVPPSVSPTPTAPAGIRVTQTCEELVTPNELFEFNQNFGPQPEYEAEPGSLAARVVELRGVACGWSNQTSNETIEIAVAHLPTSDITDLKNDLVLKSTAIPTYGDEAYFDSDSGVGTAQVFSGDYWIVARSVTFYEPGDATTLVEDVIQALS